MKKNFLQDVIPASQKRSIRDVPLPVHKEHKAIVSKREVRPKHKIEEVHRTYPLDSDNTSEQEYSFSPDEQEEAPRSKHLHTDDEIQSEEYNSKNTRRPANHKSNKSSMKKIIIGLICGVIIFLGFFISRTSAIITIQPKKVTRDVSIIIPLDTTNQLATKTQIAKTLSKTLPATSEQQVEKQASGRIKITNTHKAEPQELVKNTRFQTPSGLIYRIKDSIVIPGFTMSGSTVVPGTLEVDVYADSAGEEYNTSNVKFTIPGFSGKEQFTKITAETVGDISGGYVGVRKVVSEEAKEQAQVSLEAELKTQIEQNQNQSTEYILVPDISTLTYGELQDKADGDSITLTLSSSVDAYSFVKKDLFNFIGQNSVVGASAADKFTLDSSKLTFTVEENAIKVMGSTPITWVTDPEQLKSDFANKKRSEIATVIDGYHSFETSDANLKPFWKTRFPSDASKIEVIIND